MRLLIVSYHYAPALSPRAFRWHAIACRWVAQGHAVDVVCAAHAGSPAEQVLDGVAIRRVGGALDRWRHRMAPPSTAAAPGPRGTGDRLRQAAKWLHDLTWRRVYWPDHAATWYGPAREAARAWLRQRHHDALVTVALPFTAHRVGLACRDLVSLWLADSGDPFSLNLASPPNNLALYDGLNRRVEARVLAACDRFAITTAATQARYAAAFPAAARKTVVIPPLAAPIAVRHGDAFFPADGRRHLAYLGNLYPRIREPGPLLDLLQRLRVQDPALADRTAVHFFGAAGPFAETLKAFAAAWPDFRLHGMVDRDTVGRVLASADGLINFGNATEDQLPSKLVEYAAAGQPILNIAVREHDASATFLAGYPLAVTLAPREGALPLEPMRAFLRDMAGRRADAPAVGRFLAPYSVEQVADAYLQALGAAMPAGLAA